MTDVLHWLATTRLEGIGPIRLRRWLQHFGDMKTLFSASIADLQIAGLTSLQIQTLKKPNWQMAEKDFIWSQKNNCQLLTWDDENYPLLLKECADAPLLLYVRGDMSL